MRSADQPFFALPYAPHCTMPTPCPQPRPVATAAPREDATSYQSDGIVVGRTPVGYRPGIRHGAHVLTVSRNAPASIDLVSPPPATCTVEPDSATDVMRAPSGQRPPARRNVARAPNGSGTRHRDVGEAPSSRSTTGRRYGSGALPKTWSLPYVCPFDVEKYTASIGRPPSWRT